MNVSRTVGERVNERGKEGGIAEGVMSAALIWRWTGANRIERWEWVSQCSSSGGLLGSCGHQMHIFSDKGGFK